MTTLIATPIATSLTFTPDPAPGPAAIPDVTGAAAAPGLGPLPQPVTLHLIVTIAKFRNEAYDSITGTLKKYYGFGKFFTWGDGIESEAELVLPEMSHLSWTIESLVDHIRNLNAYPDPDRRIYCKITLQVFNPGNETPLQEYRY
jgi:hypothetical protein